MHITIIVKKKLFKKRMKRKKEKTTAQIGTNVWARGFGSGLLATSRFASGRSCDRTTRARYYVVFLHPKANAELVPKFCVALHASHAALLLITLKISSYTNVTLTFGFD
jgi:hypothetical protein